MITRLELFLENKALDSINEAVLHFSRRLEAALTKLEEEDDQIAFKLLASVEKDLGPDITLIDFDSKEGYFSFTTERHLKKTLHDIRPYDPEWQEKAYTNRYRIRTLWDDIRDDFVSSPQSVRIGKLINRLFPGEFSDKEREEFINKLKLNLEKHGEKMELVEGEDIRYWYDGENYAVKKGPLWSSCMKDDDFFDIYAFNPEVCKLLILTEQGKLKGRALVWKVNAKEFEWFMDRQYCSFDYDVEKFRNWARERGWAFRATNSIHQPSYVNFKGEVKEMYLEVQVKSKNYVTFPYMDTFKSYYPDEAILKNSKGDVGCYILESTEGGYEDLSGVWSDYSDMNLSQDDAVWSDAVDSYLHINHAVLVSVGTRSNRGWYPDDYDDVVFDDLNGQWLHRDDAYWCEAYGSYYLMDDSIEVIELVDDKLNYILTFIPDDKPTASADKKMLWYKMLVSKHPDVDEYDFFWKNELTLNYQQKFIPKDLEVRVYSEIFLTPAHADHLDFQLPNSELIKMDLVEYNTLLSKNGYLNKLKGVDKDVRPDLVYVEKEES